MKIKYGATTSHSFQWFFTWTAAASIFLLYCLALSEAAEADEEHFAPRFVTKHFKSNILYHSSSSISYPDGFIDCLAHSNPPPTLYELLVGGEVVYTADNGTMFPHEIPLDYVSRFVSGDVSVAQCRVTNKVGSVVSNFIPIQEFSFTSLSRNLLPTRITPSVSKLSCFSAFTANGNNYQEEFKRSQELSTDLWKLFTWVDQSYHLVIHPYIENSLKNGSEPDNHDDDFYVTYQNELVLLNKSNLKQSTLFQCVIGEFAISSFEVFSEQSNYEDKLDEFLVVPQNVSAIEYVTQFVQFDCIGPKRCKPYWYFNGKLLEAKGKSYQLKIHRPDASRRGNFSCVCVVSGSPPDVIDANVEVVKSREDANEVVYYTKTASLLLQRAVYENPNSIRNSPLRLRVFQKAVLDCGLEFSLGSDTLFDQEKKDRGTGIHFGWYHNGKVLDESWGSFNGSNNSITIYPQNTIIASGVYQCFANFTRASEQEHYMLPTIYVSTPIQVSVQYEPLEVAIFLPKKFEPVVEGNSVVITCTVQGGSLNQSVIWKKGNHSISSTENFRITIYSIDSFNLSPESTYEVTMLIRNAEVLDSGFYFCAVEDGFETNKIVVSHNNVSLNVLHRTSLFEGVKDTWRGVYDEAEMFCVVRVDKSVEVKVSWRFHPNDDNEQNSWQLVENVATHVDDFIINNTRSEYLTDGLVRINSTLTLRYLMKNKQGTYACHFDSIAGNVVSSGHLSVHWRPSTPQTPSVVPSIDEFSQLVVNISSLTLGLETLPITQLFVQYNLTRFQGKDVNQSQNGEEIVFDNFSESIEGNQLRISVCVKSLVKFWSSYVFRTKFTNEVGQSDFSSPSETVVMPESKPDRAPTNLEVYSVYANGVSVTAEPIDAEHVNGEGEKCCVFYRYDWEATEKEECEMKRCYQMKISNLMPYSTVIIFVKGCNNLGCGPASNSLTVRTSEGYPSKTIKLSLGTVTANSIKVFWSPVVSHAWSGPMKCYLIYVSCPECIDFGNQTIEVAANFSSYNIRDLKAYSKYVISGSLFNGKHYPEKRSNTLEIWTNESFPGLVSNVRFFDITDKSIRLVWDAPREPNGRILDYMLELYQWVGSESDKKLMDVTDPLQAEFKFNSTVAANITQTLISPLNQSTDYVLVLTARNRIGKGAATTLMFSSSFQTTFPDPPNHLAIVNITSTSASIIFSPGFSGYTSINKWIVELTKSNRDSWKGCLTHEEIDKPEIKDIQLPPKFLTPFTKYRVRIISCNVQGCSEPSPVSREFQTQPDRPIAAHLNLLTRAISHDKVQVEWNHLNNEDCNDYLSECISTIVLYNSMSRQLDDFIVHPFLFNSSTVKVFEKLSPYTKYEVHMSVENSQGKDSTLKQLVNTFNAVPCEMEQVSLQKSFPNASSLTVSWSTEDLKCSNGVITHYEAQLLYNRRVVQTLKTPFYEIGGVDEVARVTFTELRPNLTYGVRVAAVNGAGRGQWSALIKHSTNKTVPEMPGNVKISIDSLSDNKCTIAIDCYIANEDHVDSLHYKLYINRQLMSEKTRGFNDISMDGWNSFDLNISCSDNAEVEFHIWFSNSMGVSPSRVLKTVYSYPASSLEQPQNISHQSRSRSVLLKWSHPNPIKVQSYLIKVAHDMGDIINELDELETMTFDTNATIVGLSPFKKYRFFITASGYLRQSSNSIAQVDYRSQSATYYATTEKDVPDAIPFEPKFINTSCSIEMSNLKTSTRNVNGIFQGYEAQYRVFEGELSKNWQSATINNATDSITITGLQEDRTYQIRLRVLNDIGQGPWSPYYYQFVSQKAITEAPKNVKVDLTQSGPSFLQLRWERPGTDSQTKVIGFQVCYKAASNQFSQPEKCESVVSGSTNYTLELLEAYTFYTVKVRAFNHVGNGPFSQPVDVATEAGIPSKVAYFQVDVLGPNFARISWSKPLKPRGPVADIDYLITCNEKGPIEWQKDKDSRQIRSVRGRERYGNNFSLLASSVNGRGYFYDDEDRFSFTLKDLLSDFNYVFTISAKTEAGLGDPVSVDAFIGQHEDYPRPPGKPSITASEEGGAVITVVWDEPHSDHLDYPVINYALYLVYLDNTAIDTILLNKTFNNIPKLTFDRRKHRIDLVRSILEDENYQYDAWLAVTAINRNGQSFLGPKMKYSPAIKPEPMKKPAEETFSTIVPSVVIIIALFLILIIVLALGIFYMFKHFDRSKSKEKDLPKKRKKVHDLSKDERLAATELSFVTNPAGGHPSSHFDNSRNSLTSDGPRTTISFGGGGVFNEHQTTHPRFGSASADVDRVLTAAPISRTGASVNDGSEERVGRDSDSPNSSSHQPDALEDVTLGYPLPLGTVPFATDPYQEHPIPTEMGTFGRSYSKRNNNNNNQHLNPKALSQVRVPLNNNSNNNPLASDRSSRVHYSPLGFSSAKTQPMKEPNSVQMQTNNGGRGLNHYVNEDSPVSPSVIRFNASNGSDRRSFGFGSGPGSKPMKSFQASSDEEETL